MSARVLTVLALAVAALTGCGSDEEGNPIPPDTSSALESQLANIEGQIEDGSVGACTDIKEPGGTFENLEATVLSLPRRVDPDVREALEQSVVRLGELVDEECASLEDEDETQTAPEETETVTVPDETVPEETVPEETVPDETVPEETVPEDDGGGETPPDDGGTGEPGGGTGGGLPAPGDDG